VPGCWQSSTRVQVHSASLLFSQSPWASHNTADLEPCICILLTAVELVHELAEYLSRRYPADYQVVRHALRADRRLDGRGGGGRAGDIVRGEPNTNASANPHGCGDERELCGSGSDSARGSIPAMPASVLEVIARQSPAGQEEPVLGNDIGLDPSAFDDWGWEDLPPIKTITMTSLSLSQGAEVSYDLPRSVRDGERAGERAMEIAGLL